MSLRRCITGRGYDLVARQLLRPGYKAKEYSKSTLRRIHALSLTVYVVTLCTFAVTTVLYNPENAFGNNDVVSTPILSFQTRELQDNCETLVLLFDVVNIQDSADSSRDAPLTKLTLPNTRIAVFDDPSDTLKSTSLESTTIEIHPNITLSWSGDVPLCQNFMRALLAEVQTVLLDCNVYCGFAALSTAADNFTLLNGNPDVDGVQTTRTSFTAFPFEFEFGFFDLLVPTFNGGLSEFYGVGIDGPFDVEALVDSVCTATTFGDVNLANLPPFACTVTQFRGWLEVIALAGSNAGLIYAIAVVAFGALITQPASDESEEAVKV